VKQNIGDRFWSKVDKSSGPINCWPWKACIKKDGYGSFWDGDQYSGPHRIAFLLDGGILTDQNPDVLHKCHEFGILDNRACCNPLHLKAGSPKENSGDSVAVRTHRNSRKTHCRKGHELSGDNLRIQLTKNGGQGRFCRICEKAARSTPQKMAYNREYQKKLRRNTSKKRAKENALKQRFEIQKPKINREWPEKVAPELQISRVDHPLAQPIFYPDGTVLIPLSKAAWRGMYARIDFDDFEKVNSLQWTAWWCRTPGSFYATSKDENNNSIYMNRFLLGLTDRNVRGEYLSEDTLDNRRANLNVTAQRWQLRAGNTSGHPGVYWDKSRGKWAARLQLNGIGKPLGRFLKKEDAISAYRAACVKMGIEIHAR
jgi:hypothetical protein